MADVIAAKGPTETVERRWAVPVTSGDHAASVSLVASGVTASATLDVNEVVFTLSGGTTGATASIVVTVGTDLGNTIVETLYVPVVASGGSAITVNDIVSFALRKVTGIGEAPNAEQAAEALEKLTDMLEEWRVTGADVGAPRPLETSTVIYSPHAYISAIKNNLIVRLSDIYGPELVTPSVASAAVRGVQLIKSSKRVPKQPEYF